DYYTIFYGCGPGNPQFNPPLNPLFINSKPPRATLGDCSQPWPSGNHQDCVQTTPGSRRNKIICAIVARATNAPVNTTCNNNTGGSCAGSPNNWVAATGYHIPPGDPRAITMIITSDADLATGGPQVWIPIWQFATFYVTGWDNSVKPQCGD